MDLERLYKTRFNPKERDKKRELWKVLCHDFFQRYIQPTDCVLDLGAGYCEFINNIRCARKIAVDLNDQLPLHAAPDVQTVQAPSTDLHAIADSSVQVAFVSNFFEHLRSKTEFLETLEELKRVLVPRGKLLILQPNIRFLPGEYWDFLDHHLPLTDRSLVEALELVGLHPVEVRSRFLPYTTKSFLPQRPWMVRLYLRVRPAQWLLGKQAWVVAVKPEAPSLPQ